MKSILHCARCRSRTLFDTDRNGGLVERRNHVCECPPITYQPEYEEGGQRQAMLRKVNRCVDCDAEVSVRAKRCPPCGRAAQNRASLKSRKRRLAA